MAEPKQVPVVTVRGGGGRNDDDVIANFQVLRLCIGRRRGIRRIEVGEWSDAWKGLNQETGGAGIVMHLGLDSDVPVRVVLEDEGRGYTLLYDSGMSVSARYTKYLQGPDNCTHVLIAFM